ncbi:MAG TPA: inorganic phosphate transporter [Parafilimonas sp.]
MSTLLIVIIVLSVIFDFINGFHDAANSIATVVSTKVLTPFQAVIWAAFFNFVAYFVFRDHEVANTVAKTVNKGSYDLVVVLAGVIAAICWNLLTWWYGIPSSSSHTLIGGFAGAAIAHSGFHSINWSLNGGISLTLLFILLAPIIGMIISMFITIVTIQRNFWLKIAIIIATLSACFIFIKFKKPFEFWGLLILGIIFIVSYSINHFRAESAYKTMNMYKRLQLLSSATFSLGHGGSDAQKVIGIIGAAMVAEHLIPNITQIPTWVPFMCYTSIGLGTMSGGWRIVKTMGTKITKVTPLEGVCAETAGAITLFTAANLGAPVSTTHTIAGSIAGAGVTKRFSAVRWGITINLIWAWVLTIPVSALLAAAIYWFFHLFSV